MSFPDGRRATKQAEGGRRGRAFFEDACDVRAEVETEFLAALSPSRAETFVATLRVLVDARER